LIEAFSYSLHNVCLSRALEPLEKLIMFNVVSEVWQEFDGYTDFLQFCH
jgi:hypothetical protein